MPKFIKGCSDKCPPKGKKKGDTYTKKGRKYMVISYVHPTSGKRVRYGAPVSKAAPKKKRSSKKKKKRSGRRR